MLINLTHEQLTAALFALREQSAQQRTVATERRRMARALDDQIHQTAQLRAPVPADIIATQADRRARVAHLYESAAALESHSSTLDAIAEQLADGASEGPY